MKNAMLSRWRQLCDAVTQSHKEKGAQLQASLGKKTARDRLALLLDPNSFEETDMLAASPLLKPAPHTDGVITGFGSVGGRTVAVYAQDFSIKGGSLGKRHADKIVKIMDMAAKIGCPIIGIIDSGGARIDEGIHALAGYGAIFMRNVRYSGVIPQISIIFGPCAGGAAYSPALTDFVFMTKNISQLFITGPQVIEQVTNQRVTKEELGGWQVHSEQSGVVHGAYDTEEECFASIQQLIGLLPANYLTPPQELEIELPDEELRNLENILPSNANQAYDVLGIINGIVDRNSFFQLQELFAPNIVTGLARIEGRTVGIIANQPMEKAGTIDIDASTKAARFIQWCDSFDVPILSLVDVPGYLPGLEQEQRGIIRHGAKLLYAYAHASVPKITVILRKAFGGAYIVMGSKELGADFNFAWPTAQIAVLGPRAAVTILHGKSLARLSGEERAAHQQALERDYETQFLNPFIAAEYGYIDAIIEPNETRKHVARALAITKDKVESLPRKRGGNIPL